MRRFAVSTYTIERAYFCPLRIALRLHFHRDLAADVEQMLTEEQTEDPHLTPTEESVWVYDWLWYTKTDRLEIRNDWREASCSQ